MQYFGEQFSVVKSSWPPRIAGQSLECRSGQYLGRRSAQYLDHLVLPVPGV